MRKNQKTRALFMAVFFIVMIAVSSFFVIHNAHHDCTGIDCEACLQVEQAKELICGLKYLPVAVAFLSLLSVFTLIYAVGKQSVCVKNTLILLKVELLN